MGDYGALLGQYLTALITLGRLTSQLVQMILLDLNLPIPAWIVQSLGTLANAVLMIGAIVMFAKKVKWLILIGGTLAAAFILNFLGIISLLLPPK